jgi:hypothetical protein
MSGLIERIVRRRASASSRLGPPSLNGGPLGYPPPHANGAPPETPPAYVNGVDAADAPATEPPIEAAEPGFRERGRMRRRARYLRRLRELQMRDIGGFVLELHRFHRDRPDPGAIRTRRKPRRPRRTCASRATAGPGRARSPAPAACRSAGPAR